VPLDQADGLRRLFAGRTHASQRVLPLVANPHVAFSGLVLDRVAALLALHGKRVLVVDAGSRSPAPDERALLDLASAIEPLSPQVAYLPARGLPLAHVDTRGSAASFLDALAQAAPLADVVLLHADPADLARIFTHRGARPLLIAGDNPDSIKHAYAAAKLLAHRCGLMTCDLLLAAPPQSTRLDSIATSLAACLDNFLGALLHDWAVVDPAGDAVQPQGAAPGSADEALGRVLAAQLLLDDRDAVQPHRPLATHADLHRTRPSVNRNATPYGLSAPTPTTNRPAPARQG
jgi:flagellar biosynthesis protein FlhG